MLTRRGFAGFASCALCGIAEFVATEASAQGAPPAAAAGVTRKILSQTDGPMTGYTTVLVEATIEAGVPLRVSMTLSLLCPGHGRPDFPDANGNSFTIRLARACLHLGA